MLKYQPLLFFLLFNCCYILTSQAQITGLRVTSQHLNGMSFKKIILAANDHSLWALSDGGQVYFKNSNATDFSLYAPMAAYVVDDLAGYNEKHVQLNDSFGVVS